MRIGWIFKTESVLMPGFVDALGGSSAIRGWLALLARVGQSFPQFFLSHRIARLRRFKAGYLALSAAHLVPWLVLALAVPKALGSGGEWLLPLFLGCYLSHWFLYGTVRIFEGTIQGKLIPATLRGRLLSACGLVGGLSAVAAALILMPGWLNSEAPRYDRVFRFVLLCFAVSAAFLALLKEHPREPDMAEPVVRFRDTVDIIRTDRPFRRVLACAMLIYVLLVLFPHFVVLGKEKLGLGAENFARYVVFQNVGMAVWSVLLGLLADRRGNRLAFRCAALGLVMAPLAAIFFSGLGETGKSLFPLVFALIGFMPVSQRILANLVLELAPARKHPQYLSAVQLAQIMPLLCSPLVGLLIDIVSFRAVFLFCGACVLMGWLLTFRLPEPRPDT